MARLELRPNCELCDKDLSPQSSEARICSYECTYCADCAENVLHNVCPTCGGNFVPRPIRPMKSWRPEENLGLGNHPASVMRVLAPFSREDIAAFVTSLKDVAPERR
ncbi:MAG: DUF1272 domain-containing protein [Pseudomonadota bacterium]|nr:DUF1272 domain-containing protein [Pseudomonadota bacterium]